MRRLLLFAISLALAQGPPRPDDDPRQGKLPDGRSRAEEILKAEHKKSLDDAATLCRLADELKAELEKNDRHVVSVSQIRKTEEIEKLARRIRGRLRRY